MEKCWNCYRDIADKETPHVFEGHVVCAGCDLALRVSNTPSEARRLRADDEQLRQRSIAAQERLLNGGPAAVKTGGSEPRCHLCGGRMVHAMVPAFPKGRHAGLAVLLLALLMMLFSTDVGLVLLPVWLVVTIFVHQKKQVLHCAGCGATTPCS